MKPVARLVAGLVLAGICLGVVAFFGVAYFPVASSKVLPGVSVKGIDLEGLDRESGLKALQALDDEIRSVPVVLSYQEKMWEIKPARIDLRADLDAIMDLALQAGNEGNPIMRWQKQRQIREYGFEIPVRISLNKELFYRELDNISREVAISPVDATFNIDANDNIEIVPGKDGMVIDKDSAYNALLSVLSNTTGPRNIQLSLVKAKPHRSTEEVASMGLKGLLGIYKTTFDASNTSRSYNIRVAAAALDGLLVAPGQEVSFNKVVGPRSSEAGYKNAKVIVNNELVDGLGGGVCQVSSTLYNAILMANLEVLERKNHSLPVSYVPLGRDATVVYGAVDFKFKNNTESYIYIRSFMNAGQITLKVYGNTDYKVPVNIRTWTSQVIEPKVEKQPDHNLKKGEEIAKQKGSRGFRIAAERIIIENGVTKREELPGSFYQPVKRIIAVGTKEEEVPPIILPSDHGTVPSTPGTDPSPPPLVPPDGATDNNESEGQGSSITPPVNQEPGTQVGP